MRERKRRWNGRRRRGRGEREKEGKGEGSREEKKERNEGHELSGETTREIKRESEKERKRERSGTPRIGRRWTEFFLSFLSEAWGKKICLVVADLSSSFSPSSSCSLLFHAPQKLLHISHHQKILTTNSHHIRIHGQLSIWIDRCNVCLDVYVGRWICMDSPWGYRREINKQKSWLFVTDFYPRELRAIDPSCMSLSLVRVPRWPEIYISLSLLQSLFLPLSLSNQRKRILSFLSFFLQVHRFFYMYSLGASWWNGRGDR